eukprot:13746411-Ditylum_brightwellii.AAC.1
MNEDKNVIELLKSIKGTVFQFEEEQYLELALWEAVLKAFYFYQGPGINNATYFECFDNAIKLIEQFGGSVLMHPSSIKTALKRKRANATLQNVRAHEFDKTVRDARERFLPVIVMAGADCSRYGSMFQDIQNNYGQGNDTHPKSVVDTKHCIKTFRPNPKYVRVISQAEGMVFLADDQEKRRQINCT